MSRPSEISSNTVFLSSSDCRATGRRRPSLHRRADAQLAAVRAFLPGDHAEQRGLAGAVRADDADDAALRQVEVEVVEQQLVAVRLRQPLGLDHQFAEARAGRDVDLVGLVALLGIRCDCSSSKRCMRALLLAWRAFGILAHPFEFARERLLAARSCCCSSTSRRASLLLEPGRVVALPRDAVAAVEFEDPAGDVVEEVAVVGDRDDGARVLLAGSCSSQRTDSASRWLVGSSSSSMSGFDSSNWHSATRRRSPPEILVTSASHGGRRSASAATSSCRSRL